MDERTALLALSLVPGIGSGRLHMLVEAYGNSAVEAWRQRHTWSTQARLPTKIAQAAREITLQRIERERRRLDALNARILTRTDPEYPAGLLHVAGPTPVLFVRGRLPTDYERCVAIVGTRRPSIGGERTSRELASHLSAVGLTVVSGMALGVDGAAHWGALQAGGVTVAVLGCGLDFAYPRRHGPLMEQIATTGAVVTEYPLGTEPLARHFPARNRIIAGLSAAVILVESGRTGGALHTVEYALAAGREVMAVPGDVHRWQSEGPNQLLREGAVLVRHAADVLEALGHTSWPVPHGLASDRVASSRDESTSSVHDDPLSRLGRRIIRTLSQEGALSADELTAGLRASSADVAAALTWLEVAGRVVRVPGGRFHTPR